MPPNDPPDPASTDRNARFDLGEDHALSEEPEFASIEAFAEYLSDDDRTTYRPAELVKLMKRTKLSREAAIAQLLGYGYVTASR